MFAPSPCELRDPHKIMPAQTAPSPLRERVGVRASGRTFPGNVTSKIRFQHHAVVGFAVAHVLDCFVDF